VARRCEVELEGFQRVDGREAGDPGQHVVCPNSPRLALGFEHMLQEVAVGGVIDPAET